ncbi:dephospho-CoA kinase [Chryseobacterium gallinarum]|uniref:Dephospho-CoA kinase n=1 Tax=Chryseobacterium gallinarum TaxID=1324352 RepID=A0A0G3LZT0_CHRGL|nr:dephospho-CoA kinase [Chryseobacterium gallinarum]AKK72114.1 dephospho-CoA kinase [Chryseobacterium gallinarum]MCL8535675.1 dephospho-CoA kinase [Chryseobacterium gallinarum]QIY92182.1 dephospho-CoA kinase [Chryseobacterium gallinarum]
MEELHSETQKKEPEPAPKIIGLTGGIGSGKTTVARFIEEFGFPVYYSDDRAKTIVNDNENLKIKIKELLGDEAYDENGLYDRKFVAGKVFNNKELLHQLNEIIHPAVRLDFEDWVRKQTKYLVFKETALLFELKLNRQCYKSLLVTAEDNIRIKRVMDRDGKTYREVEAVMEKQMPEKDKIKMADCIIYNNTNLEELKEQTERIVFNIE